MLQNTGVILEDYTVSLRNGFLPDTIPLAHLPEPYYNPWECIAADLPELIRTGRIREEVEGLPVLSTDKLHTEAEWRRAYVLLAFFTHAYIWGGQKPQNVGFPQYHLLMANWMESLQVAYRSCLLRYLAHFCKFPNIYNCLLVLLMPLLTSGTLFLAVQIVTSLTLTT